VDVNTPSIPLRDAADSDAEVEPEAPSSALERLLLVLLVLSLPLEEALPTTGRFSVPFALLASLLIVVALTRPYALVRVSMQPVSALLGSFLIFTLVIELIHPHPDLSFWVRTLQMVVGGLVVAAACRDRRTVQLVLFGAVVAGTAVAVFLIWTLFGPLSTASTRTFESTTVVRDTALGSTEEATINTLGYLAAQAMAIATAVALTTNDPRTRRRWYLVLATGFAGVLLSVSRGSIGTAAVAIVLTLLLGTRQRRASALAVAVALSAGLFLAPPSVYARLTLHPSGYGNRQEARSQIYNATERTFSQYAFAGVGAGNFREWGVDHGFSRDGRTVLGTHNSLTQIAVFWGLLPVALFVIAMAALYRLAPPLALFPRGGLALRSLAIAAGANLMVTHTLYDKSMSVVLGLLIGTSLWIVPRSLRTTTQPSDLV
jgi:hypothetical protein